MNTILWNEVLKFELNNPNDKYGFLTRLALENKWTIHFAETAILEYKKFMYLAAISNDMVSPSEIVDIVWHQHLIFTSSYTDLCTLLSKRIEHIPSTHNRSDAEKFHKAKERTKELYEQNFGKQPEVIWEYSNELDSLNLEKSAIEIDRLKRIFIGLFAVLIFPVYYLIRPVLIQIGNPDFLICYILLFVIVIVLIMRFVKKAFASFYQHIQSNFILVNLSPFELVFLQHNKLEFVIHGVVNNLISNKKIEVLGNNRLNLIDESLTDDKYENCVIEIMKEYEPMPYPQLFRIVARNPIYEQLEKAVSRIRKTIVDSQQFMQIIKIVLLVFGLLLSIGFSRIISGISRDKPVAFLVFTLFALLIVTRIYFRKIVTYLFSTTMPLVFTNEKMNSDTAKDWHWNYFLYGEVLLVSSFLPLTGYLNRNGDSGSSSWSSCGSSCGSSCSSSCGSSCGGCGGD
ncbi:hypothetical protein [Flavobacterium sp. LC2016-12]|uniref:hypothetical protein n=1 Tax=Flavobacterium sp. LC2016-12 TaxID=2783794 RepID=UPI00188C218C|nr:hypothetical protein [Flavobacterium sp. LC2016-12]MBF4465811.1 hypothetical protein [Flavobacterium sp. LC2016-12]